MASSSSTSGYATVSSDSSSGSSTPTPTTFQCDCGRALNATGGPVILGTCGHNFCGICTGMMIADAAAEAGMTWLTVLAIVCKRCNLESSTTTLRRNDVALELFHAAEVDRDISHTLMQHAAAKIQRLQDQLEEQKTIDEKLEQAATILQVAKKSIVEERKQNALLKAEAVELKNNVDAIGFQLRVEEGVRKRLDLRLKAFERMFPHFDPTVAPPPGFEGAPRNAFRPPPPQCPLPQPPIGTGRPSRNAVPPPTAASVQPRRITMDVDRVECAALEAILSRVPSEYGTLL